MDIQESRGTRLIGALLRVPFLSVVEHIYDALIEAGYSDLRSSHLPVFQQIDEDNGSHLTELAERAVMTKQSMGYLVDYLEEKGYVERGPDPSDGRGKIVRLTERGRGVMSTARTVVRNIEDEWAGIIGKQRMQNLRETLADLVAVLEGTQNHFSPNGKE
jgi:DNA-binding MarR family transcriptional regulator